jgi:hypothetical protein
MKHLAKILWLVPALVLLYGCGGERTPGSTPGSTSANSGPSSDPPPQGLNIAGNWQFSTRSTAGTPPWTIAGSISQSGSKVGSVLHVDGSSCFEQPTAIRLTGTLAGGNISLTSTPVRGQVITLAGTITKKDGFPYQLTGTYTIDGGCASGEQGSVTGDSVGAFNGSWYGNLTTAGGADIHWGTDQLGQVGPSSEGSFGLTGNFNFDGACFNSGKLTPGTYPAPSYILGTSVALKIPTDNGTIAFVGTAGPDEGGLIRGTYTVTGGSCESTGTGYLSPWEY